MLIGVGEDALDCPLELFGINRLLGGVYEALKGLSLPHIFDAACFETGRRVGFALVRTLLAGHVQNSNPLAAERLAFRCVPFHRSYLDEIEPEAVLLFDPCLKEAENHVPYLKRQLLSAFAADGSQPVRKRFEGAVDGQLRGIKQAQWLSG